MKTLIALIDDDRNILISLEELLKKEEFEIHTYADGQSALNGMFKRPPALAVIDIKMPRMDGFEFLENFVDMDFDEKPNILVYSGKDLSEVQEELLRKNVAGLVKKDEVSINQLPAMVTKLLGSKS